ncbi:EmrB/QacA subfamily drug resistance transporter [Motilibacter rhizosphaerae]|uniref:EmrB/QacA subfamily drug resistance transporter n=1 Tax=Motilibacter rhizosphaerae TaxID=598652 RepID=A0A4Q7NUN4_9ACTN|nr:MFS transporter [Motilibacter rhizosphaerae]RZS90877.1 EmrB/QacA subfamily drug resistance transporter [Motilibacter rhizosphaerae]
MSDLEIRPAARGLDPVRSPRQPLSRPVPSPRSAPPARRGLVLAVILLTQLMVVLDGTIVNVALPELQRALDFTPARLSWVLNAYALTFGGLLLFGARCGDVLGRRRTFLLGISVFTIASLLGGLATSDVLLLAARALQGVGGALAAPAALTLLATTYPDPRERLRAIGLYAAVSVGGAATGLLAGGVLTEYASWRWVFLVNLPFGIAALVGGAALLRETPRTRLPFDLTGALSSTLGVGALVYGLVESTSAGWSSVRTLAPLAAGTALIVVFVLAERAAAQPILPLRLLASPSRSGANAARGLLYAGAYGMFFYLTQYLQGVRGFSPVEAGLSFLPLPLSVFTLSQLTTRVLVGRFSARTLMLTGLGISTVGLALDTRLSPTTPYAMVLLSLVLFGAGNGISFVTLTGAAIADVAPEDAGAASGLVNVSQQLGAALGVALLVTVFGDAGSLGASTLAGAARFTHGVDHVFAGAALLALSSLVMVALTSRVRRTA